MVSRSGLGVELGASFELGPLTVVELVMTLPGIGFPVDLSGGVNAFRNRRGRLEELGVRLETPALQRFVARRLAGVLGDAEVPPNVLLAVTEDGWLVGLSGERFALAFELLVVPADGDVVLVPMHARALGLAGPAQRHALEAVAVVAKGVGAVRAGRVIVADAAVKLARALLPAGGMRAPEARGLRAERVVIDVAAVALAARRLDAQGAQGRAVAALGERIVRALELAELAGEAEDALVRGDRDEARRGYLAALERAPRHPELSRRAAELDCSHGGRSEAAASLLADAAPLIHAGVLGGRLLAELGDRDGAYTAFSQAGELEPYGALAALAWLEASRFAPSGDASLAALDEAVARAPALALVRWARFEARLAGGDVRGAREDASGLEAAANGAAARHAVARRSAASYAASGLWPEAVQAFERALRYRPDDAQAVAGLARALGAGGERQRALELLVRAVALAERAGQPDDAVLLDLGRALAEVAGDLPAAIARVRAVAPFGAESFEARGLEARWRAELGDLAGASAALGRLVEAVERVLALLAGDAEPDPHGALFGAEGRYPRREDACAALAALLAEGATLHERERGDVVAARRAWGLALRLRPQEKRFRREVARLGKLVAGAPAVAPRAEPAEERAAEPESARGPRAEALPATPARDPAPAARDEPDDVHDEARAAELEDKLRANPADVAVAQALAGALVRLGRFHELFALAAARLDEVGESEAALWLPFRTQALEALAAEAEGAGRAGEAALYRDMLAQGR